MIIDNMFLFAETAKFDLADTLNTFMKFFAGDVPFFYLLSICLLVIIVLLMVLRRPKGDVKAGRFLLIYFCSYLYLIAITYLFVYGNPIPFIHALRTGHIASLLMPVLAFFYVHQLLFPFRWRWHHVVHLLPVLVFIVDFAPFFALSATEKAQHFARMDAAEYRIGFSQGWFMPRFGHIAIRTLLLLVYWLLQFRLLLQARQQDYHPLRLQYPYTWRWLHLFIITQGFIFIFPLLGTVLKDAQAEAVIFSMAAAGTMAIQSFYLLLHPEILYTETFGKTFAEPNPVVAPAPLPEARLQVQDDATHKVLLPPARPQPADFEHVAAAVQQVLDNKRPFTQQGYSLHNLAEDTGYSAQKLSAYINASFAMNFNDYLNKYRLEMVTARLDAGENAQKTLEAIAFECGFQSRVTFIRAFKKAFGVTPTEYLNQKKA